MVPKKTFNVLCNLKFGRQISQDFWELGQVYKYWRQTTSSCEILCIDTEAQLHKRRPPNKANSELFLQYFKLLPF